MTKSIPVWEIEVASAQLETYATAAEAAEPGSPRLTRVRERIAAASNAGEAARVAAGAPAEPVPAQRTRLRFEVPQ